MPDDASRATKIGSVVRLVISLAAPVLCIQPPVFDRRLAIQSGRKARLASGAKGECECERGAAGGRFTSEGAFIRPSTEGLLVDSMGLVVHPADRADDVVGGLV